MTALLAISLGCPGGIGPEVTLAALAATSASWRAVLFGELELLKQRAPAVGFDAARLRLVPSARAAHELAPGLVGVVEVAEVPALSADGRTPGRPTREGGRAQLAWIDAASDAVARGEADALVTGPASKEAIASSGAPGSAGFLGHTEHLGARLGALETVMAFVSGPLIVTLATTHLPLARVPSVLSAEDVARASYWTARLCDALAIAPELDVAVLALNPHAGEHGLLGDEETTIVTPGIDLGRLRLGNEGRRRQLVGPLPAESALRRTVHQHAYAACVALYHDQATIPAKLVAFGDAVNVTLGLPIVRTSVDHGTAYDVAGTGRADAHGMASALDLAVKLRTGAAELLAAPGAPDRRPTA